MLTIIMTVLAGIVTVFGVVTYFYCEKFTPEGIRDSSFGMVGSFLLAILFILVGILFK